MIWNISWLYESHGSQYFSWLTFVDAKTVKSMCVAYFKGQQIELHSHSAMPEIDNSLRLRGNIYIA